MSASQRVQQHPVVQQAQNKAKFYHDQLDKEVGTYLILCRLGTFSYSYAKLSKFPVLNTFEQRTQVPKTYAVLGAVATVTLLHLFNPLAGPISNLVGWALPAYLSLRAIESPGHGDDIQWLAYWIVFGFLNFLESIALGIVLYYMPWYFVVKTLFLLWLQLPTFRVRPPFLFLAIYVMDLMRCCSFFLQGGQIIYHSLLKHVVPGSLPSSSDATTAERLRDRVGAASD
jgi:receptor expression-enhancing protein 5/6